MNANMTNTTRTMVESVFKYSAIPPQMPQILLSYNDFVSRFCIFCIFVLIFVWSTACIFVCCQFLSIYSFVDNSPKEGCQAEREHSPQFTQPCFLSYVFAWSRIAPKKVSFLRSIMAFVEMNSAMSCAATEPIGSGVLLSNITHHGIVEGVGRIEMIVTGIGSEKNVLVWGVVSSAKCRSSDGYIVFVGNEYFVTILAALGYLSFACTGTAEFIHSVGIDFMKIADKSFAWAFDFNTWGNCFANFASGIGVKWCYGVAVGQFDDEIELLGIYIVTPCSWISYLPTYVFCAEEVAVGRLNKGERRCLLEVAHICLHVGFGAVG